MELPKGCNCTFDEIISRGGCECGALSCTPESAGWVSVSDELPKESGKYSVKVKRGSAKVTTEETETLFFKKPNRSYWGIGGDWDVVTHWKPNDYVERETKRK